MTEPHSKLELAGARLTVRADEARRVVEGIFHRLGCTPETARAVAEHLTDASLCGVESHGLMRTLQYAEQMESGYLRAEATPSP